MTRLTSVPGRVAIALLATALLAGLAIQLRNPSIHVVTFAAPATVPAPQLVAVPLHATKALGSLPVPTGLTPARLNLRAAPVAVPLTLEIPSIGVNVAVLGVGITPNNVMDAPEGPAADPVWQQAFWYRGSAVPGARSTALFAGHIDDPLGRPGSFAHIDRLQRGDLIVVHDTRTGLDMRFAVAGSVTYPLAVTTNPAVLTQIYGAGPIEGKVPQPSRDGLAHLTLVTCAGTFQNSLGTHDHRLVVFATRIA